MLSFIEIGFYISLAVMFCLLFLLINHLKSRIITLENQNEGLMDVMKMIRGNLVISDKEQKQVKESILSLAKNVSQVSNVVHSIQNKRLEKNNITLEVEDLTPVQGNITNNWTAESEEDDTEEGTQPNGEEHDLEVVNIDWPTDDNIEIRKIATDENATDDLELNRRMMEMAQFHISRPMFANSSDASDLQKMFFMMSMGNGIPMSNIIFENRYPYEILPESFDDPDVEKLPESPMPELIDIDEEEREALIGQQELNTRIDELITEVTVAIEPEPEAKTETDNVQMETYAIPTPEIENGQTETEPEQIESIAPETEQMETTTEKEEKSMDFSKMDLRTLRSLVSTQGKASNEKVSKMKKAELLRILSSSTE